jgi:hypothetical protein
MDGHPNFKHRKKSKMQKLLLFAVLLSGVFITSCQKKMSSIDCKIKPYMSKPFSFNSSTSTIVIPDIEFMQTTYENDSVVIATKGTKATDFIRVNDFVNQLTGEPINSISILFYIEGDAENTTTITESNIKGISIFSNSGKFFRHRYFHSENGKLKEIDEISTDAYAVFLQSEMFMHKYIARATLGSSFTLTIYNTEAEFPQNKINADLIQKKARKYLSANKSISSREGNTIIDEIPEGGCSSCNSTADGGCHRNYGSMNGEPTYVCRVRVCGSGHTERTLRDNNAYPNDSLNLTFRNSLHYSFRDSLLSNTPFGRRYINFYYDLSSIYYNRCGIGLMLSSSRTLLKYNSLIESLVTPSNNDNQQFLTPALKNELFDLIVSFKAVYNDSYTEDVFYQVIQDVNSFGTKTVDQVRQEYFNR